MARGLKETIYDPIADDVERAYWQYRAARERYPAADGVLNFVPYVGAAINADDVFRDVRDGASIGEITADAAGAAVNLALLGKYGKAAHAVGDFTKEVASTTKRMTKNFAGEPAMYSLAGTAVATPPVMYAAHYADKQQKADEKYGDASLNAVAAEIRAREPQGPTLYDRARAAVESAIGSFGGLW